MSFIDLTSTASTHIYSIWLYASLKLVPDRPKKHSKEGERSQSQPVVLSVSNCCIWVEPHSVD